MEWVFSSLTIFNVIANYKNPFSQHFIQLIFIINKYMLKFSMTYMIEVWTDHKSYIPIQQIPRY